MLDDEQSLSGEFVEELQPDIDLMKAMGLPLSFGNRCIEKSKVQ